jgi:hypothetical protein
MPDDGMDIRQLFTTLREGWLFVVAVGAVTLLTVLLFTAFSDMEFRTRGRLYLGELNHAASAAQLDELDLSEESSGDVGSELEILKSQTLISRAILDSGLNVYVAPAGSKRPVYFQWRLAGRDANLLDPTHGRLVAKNASLTDPTVVSRELVVHFRTDKTYELWSSGTRLGKGELDEASQVPGVRLTLQRGARGAPKAGERYDLSVWSVEGTAQSVLNDLIVTVPKSVGSAQPVCLPSCQGANACPLVRSVCHRPCSPTMLHPAPLTAPFPASPCSRLTVV